jgi:hypothetical protein
MRLADDWRIIVRRAWSIRLMLLAMALSGLEVILPARELFAFLPDRLWALCAVAVTGLAFWARIAAQRGL